MYLHGERNNVAKNCAAFSVKLIQKETSVRMSPPSPALPPASAFCAPATPVSPAAASPGRRTEGTAVPSTPGEPQSAEKERGTWKTYRKHFYCN